MMLLAGASLAAVPALARCPAVLLAAPCAGTPALGATASAVPAATPIAADDELAELAEHPAKNVPPASMTPPIARPATALSRVRLVRADRRFKLSVFNMPM